MIAVIRYKTPYFINKRDRLFISFALGNDVSLRCVLGLPTLLALCELINLVKGGFICSEIGRTFPLTCIAVNKILEYSRSIHQLRRWSQKRLDYKFAKIHRTSSMMKDVDGLSRHIDVLIYRYLTQARSMHLVDIAKRPFSYSFDSFISCSNPRRVTASNSTITTETYSPLPHFQLFSIFHFILHPYLFFNHIPSQNLLLISFITLFPLKTLFCYLLTPLLPLLVHSFLFGLEEQLHTSDSKQTCTVIVLLPCSQNLLYRNIQHSHIFFIALNYLQIFVVYLISRLQNNVFTTIRTLGH